MPACFLPTVTQHSRWHQKLKELTIHDIHQWISKLKTDGLKLRQQPYTAKTINRKLSAINNYFLWLVMQGALVDNPAAGLHVPFDFSNRYAPELWVKHTSKKVKKDRKLKLPQETEPVFRDYVSVYHITDVLFPCTPRFVESLTTDIAQRSGVQKKVTASILRDTYAVRCLKRGEAIELVLKKLGLSEATWEDARIKYLKLASQAI